jgi:hypothetical protein
VEPALTSSDNNEKAGRTQPPDNLRGSLAFATAKDGPLDLGDFQLDDEGRLRPRTDGSPIVFGFSYRGVDFVAKVATGAAPKVCLSAELGKLPYRATPGGCREQTKRVAEATADLPRGRISISADQDMQLSAETAAPAPLTPASLMSALVALLLDFKPYIELLHEVMLAPDASQAESSAAS